MMLASSAMMALGDVPNPMIPEESDVLEDILYDLQTPYVATTKRA